MYEKQQAGNQENSDAVLAEADHFGREETDATLSLPRELVDALMETRIVPRQTEEEDAPQ